MSPRDAKKKESYERLKQFAKDNGFELLTPEWLGIKVEHQFRHIESGVVKNWKPRNIFYGQGFPKDLRSDEERYEELKQFAKDNGFDLLTTEWLGTMVKHQFRHIESGQEYEGRPDQIRRIGFPMVDGQRYLTQEVCRQAFVHIFGGEFRTNRDRLKSRNDGKPIELDGYEEFANVPRSLKGIPSYINKSDEVAFNLSVAFEFQGHQNHREREKTIDRDKLKAKLCKEEGILLVQIEPTSKRFWDRIRDSNFIYGYVCDAIQVAVGENKKLDFPPGFKIDLSNWNPDRERYEELKQFAKDNGFDLLTPEWLGTMVKHQFRHIETGAEYEWTPNDIRNRNGFPKILNRYDDQHHYSKLKEKAYESGFELLTPKWMGAKVKHQFRHVKSRGVVALAPDKIKTYGFPKAENFNKYDDNKKYNRLKQEAVESGFELLTTEWLGAKVKHQFRHIGSGKDYEWTPNQIKSQGFPKNLRTDEDRYSELKQLAKENNFELLTPMWLGTNVKHQFRHIESGEMGEWAPDQIKSKGFPKRFLKQDQPQPTQVSPTIITKRIATLNALTQPFRDGMNMVAGQTEDVTRARQRPAG